MNTTMKIVVVVLVLAAVTGVIAMKQRGTDTPQTPPVATKQIEVPAKPAVEDNVPTQLPRLIDLGADRCIPCKDMAPILEALRHDFVDQFEVIFIDVWKDQAAGEAHGIKMIPTQIFFDAQGNELFRHEGFYSREEILAKWAELGIELGLPVVTEAGT